MTKQLVDLVPRGKTEAGAISFIRDDPIRVQTQALLKRAMTLPVSVEMLEDRPAMKFYTEHRGRELFDRSLGDAVVEAIEDAGAREFRPRPWETNKRAVRRAVREVERVSTFDAEAVPLSRSKTVVGAFAEGVTLWTRGDVKIDTSNNVNDYFARNLVAVRFEQFVTATVYTPSAFAIVKTRDWRRVRRVFR